MQKSHCRLDWHMGMYLEMLLARFLLDILQSSLVGLDILLGSLIDVGKEC